MQCQEAEVAASCHIGCLVLVGILDHQADIICSVSHGEESNGSSLVSITAEEVQLLLFLDTLVRNSNHALLKRGFEIAYMQKYSVRLKE